MPFCCCRGQTVVAFLGGGYACVVTASDEAGSSHPDDGHGHLALGNEGSGGSGCSGEGTSRDHGDEPCDCGHQTDLKNIPNPPVLPEFGPDTPSASDVLAEDLPSSRLVSLHKRWRLERGVRIHRLTSLLRQHCALII